MKKPNLFVRFLFAVLSYLAFGAFEVVSGKPFDVALFTSPIALTWLLGVVSGYVVWDLTNPLAKSGIKSGWRKFRKKDPLSFEIDYETKEDRNGVCTEIFALFSNHSNRKVKDACLTVDKMSCDNDRVEYLEYCIDVPPNANKLKVPLFDVKLEKGANIAKYRVSNKNLKTDNSTDWCPMIEMSFEFEPCFSTNTQDLDCEVNCTVAAPFSAKEPIKIFEQYGYRRLKYLRETSDNVNAANTL